MKLVSLNIEQDKHLEKIDPFFVRERPDVLCLQEVFKDDAARIAKQLDMHYVFGPMVLRASRLSGIAILSKTPMDEVKIQNYHSPSPDLMEVDESQKRATIRHVLLSMKTVYDGVPFPIATTHFTWTPNGLSDENQKIDAEALFALLSDIPDVLLCGDFNIPRGHNELYEKFTALYEDAIPKSYASSLDLSLHKSGRDPIQGPNLAKYMVDYLFLSKGYGAENVRLEPGVSDHMGIVATVLAKTQGR